MTDLELSTARSNEYNKLLSQLKDCMNNAYDTARSISERIYEQGKRDNLPNELIRNDIEIALAGVVKERHLTRILPAELKRSGGYKPRKVMMSFQNQNQQPTTQLATDSISKRIHIQP